MDCEPFREYVFCHYCNQWDEQGKYSVTSLVIGGVIRQLLYHTTVDYFGASPMTHIANWRREENGME